MLSQLSDLIMMRAKISAISPWRSNDSGCCLTKPSRETLSPGIRKSRQVQHLPPSFNQRYTTATKSSESLDLSGCCLMCETYGYNRNLAAEYMKASDEKWPKLTILEDRDQKE